MSYQSRKSKTSRLILASGCFVAALLALLPPAAFADTLNTWVTKAPMPTARFGAGAASVNGIVYVIGGDVSYYGCAFTGANEAYDPATNTWITMAPMPTPRALAAVAELNGIIYVVSGDEGCYPGSTVVEAYDPATNTWTTKAPLPASPSGYGVSGAAVGVINGILYVAGGTDSVSPDPFSWLYAYDPVANTWSAKAPMPDGRFASAGAVVNGRLYVVGGDNNLVGFATSTFVYDPTSNTWSTKAPLSVPRIALAATAVNNHIYAIGGNASTGGFLDTMEAYDPATDTWTTLPSMPTPRFWLGADQVNGTIYAIGGLTNGFADISTLEAYTPASSQIQQPINADGSSVFKASRGVVPVKFTLTVGGVATCALPNATISLTRTAGGTIGPIDENVYVSSADSGPNFRVSGCQYIYNLDSNSLGTGTYRVDISIGGGVVGSAVFGLK